ncbi:aminotransferase class V-fold PLP-dependent enzyme [Marinomonas sp. PE14-40]|uniref:aminotransferase class V-fold PLP-dependent enzyme n=1 Tax=Marinomonas sp. PE14-40 TaxID=3060621 RepID=UPI003F6662D8
MYPRKTLDIPFAKIFKNILFNKDKEGARFEQEGYLACFSVRSGFDLLINSLGLAPEHKILMSEVNIKGMVDVVEANHKSIQLISLDDDLDIDADIDEYLDENTKLVVIAQLFGGYKNIDALIQKFQAKGVFVVEDLSQAYQGNLKRHSPYCDAAFYSFGPLKTASLVGGGIVYLKDKALLKRMQQALLSYPKQAELTYVSKVIKFYLFHLLLHKQVYSLISRLLGDKLTSVVNRLSQTNSGPFDIESVRLQPCSSLKRMLIEKELPVELQGENKYESLIKQLDSHISFVNKSYAHQKYTKDESTHFWLFAVRSQNSAALMNALRLQGFDAFDRTNLLLIHQDAEKANTAGKLADLVYLPCLKKMNQKSLVKMAETINRLA